MTFLIRPDTVTGSLSVTPVLGRRDRAFAPLRYLMAPIGCHQMRQVRIASPFQRTGLPGNVTAGLIGSPWNESLLADVGLVHPVGGVFHGLLSLLRRCDLWQD
jgi:hypothetical protein